MCLVWHANNIIILFGGSVPLSQKNNSKHWYHCRSITNVLPQSNLTQTRVTATVHVHKVASWVPEIVVSSDNVMLLE